MQDLEVFLLGLVQYMLIHRQILLVQYSELLDLKSKKNIMTLQKYFGDDENLSRHFQVF